MHLSDCAICGRRELRGARAVHIVPTPAGDVFALTCRTCGTVMTATTHRVLHPATLHAVA